MTQKEFISNLCASNPDAVIVGSLGTISTDLAEIDHKHKIITKGAMGCAIGIGLGYAMHSPKKVIVIIGDGAYLMKLGSISTVAAANLDNLEIHVINNNCYKSCGGQKTNFKSLWTKTKMEFHEILS